jgi:hypothetical protein
MESTIEQRSEKRTDLSWPVSIWLPEANRFFNGRSANISKKGAFVTIPMTVPVREGNVVEINFPRTRELAEEKGSYARIKSGKVMRVERRKLLDEACIGIGVEFE